MFVRHPMDRMLSAYLDKMVSVPWMNYFPPYRNCIKDRARKVMLNRQSNTTVDLPNCTLEDAVRMAESFDINKSAVPTFEEFLEFVLSTDLHGTDVYNTLMHQMTI